MNPSDGFPAAQDEFRVDAPDDPLALIVGPAARGGRESAAAHRWDSARADFERLGCDGRQDLGLIRSRLAHGADPAARGDSDGETALHRAAELGSPEVMAELLRHVEDVDVRAADGRTPLWEAVCQGAGESVALLLDAGADAWTPQLGGRSPGRLALTTSLAPLFERLRGVVPLTEEERTAQREADGRAAVFRALHAEGLSAAFVAGIDEEAAIRRLGADPDAAPVTDSDADDPFGYGFDPYDEEAESLVGITAVPGGCVLVQPAWFLMNHGAVLDALSPGTTAYGVYFNPKGGTFGTLSRDGRFELHEEIGFVFGDEPDRHWLYRFWQWDKEPWAWGAYELAYASDMGGVRLAEGQPLIDPPRRWARIPQGSPLLS